MNWKGKIRRRTSSPVFLREASAGEINLGLFRKQIFASLGNIKNVSNLVCTDHLIAFPELYLNLSIGIFNELRCKADRELN